MPANTTPDGIVYPTSTDPIAPLNAHFQDLAESVQDSLSARQGYTYRWANAVARTGQTGMRVGDTGFQVDIGAYYQYTGSAWIFSSYIDTDRIAYTAFPLNGWTADSPVFYQRSNGWVQWEGRITGGSTATAINIPAGFRPNIPAQQQIPAITGTVTTLTRLVLSSTTIVALSGSAPGLFVIHYPVAAP